MTSILACALLTLTQKSTGPTILVLNKAENTVWLINASTKEVMAKLPTGPNPNEVAVSPNQKLAAISDMGGNGVPAGMTLTIIDLQKREVQKTVSVKPHGAPHGLVWLSDSRIAFTSHISDTVNEIDLTSGTITKSIKTGQKGTHLVVFNKNQSRAYAVNALSGTVSAIDYAKGEVIAQIAAGNRAEGISISPNDKWVACGNVAENTVSIIDTASNSVVKTISNIGGPIRTLFTQDSKQVLVSSVGSKAVEVYDTSTWTKTASVALNQVPVASADYGDQWPVPMNLWRLKSGNILVVLVTSHAIAEIDVKTWKVAKTFGTGGLPDGVCATDTTL